MGDLFYMEILLVCLLFITVYSFLTKTIVSNLHTFGFLFSCKEHCLHPNQCVLFTWDEPSGTKEFVWFVKGSQETIQTDLSKVCSL